MSDDQTAPEAEGGWDDVAFKRRIANAAALRSMTMGEVCVQAGLARDFLTKDASKAGRSINSILRIARVLEEDPAELMGLGRSRASVDNDSLGRLALAANIAAHLYLALDARRTLPTNVDASELIGRITGLMERA
jgi:hypothetical protein